jgi:hypothetical protein
MKSATLWSSSIRRMRMASCRYSLSRKCRKSDWIMLNRMEPHGKKLYGYIRKLLFLKYLSEDVKDYKVLMLRQPAVKTVSTKLRFNNRRNRFRARPLNSDIGPPTSSAGSCQEYKSFVAITVTLLASKARSTEPGSPPGFFLPAFRQPGFAS